MSKHRTKAQKLKIAEKRAETNLDQSPGSERQSPSTIAKTSLTWTGGADVPNSNFTSVKKDPKNDQFIWRFSPSLIYQDLFKTGLASALIVGILLLIYYLSFSR